MLEPWMFGVKVTVDGRPVGFPQVCNFTMLGRARMAYRRLRGRPELKMTPIEP
ncbi:hypothetical protein [uncultured Jatrophihabitans sp.]|uniref:hypothetical protein n=1 Tax=uncultured Jatrophihabitans sp. TaxID=1610747 RepID=UPI0035CBDB48